MRRIQVGIGVGLALLLVGVVGVMVFGGGGEAERVERPAVALPPPQTTDLATAARRAGARSISYDYAFGINEHPDGRVRYPTNPPTNGPHSPMVAQDGNYAGVPTPPTEQLVHSLEHGRIHIQYRPGLPAKDVAKLEALYAEAPDLVLLYENQTDMPCEVAVTAWGHGLLCKRFTDASIDAIRAFRERYRDQGPEKA